VVLRYATGYILQNSAPGTLDKVLRNATASFSEPGGALDRHMRALWGPRLPVVEASEAPWVGRELKWHSHMLQAAVTFDSYFGQRVLDQGTAYRYTAGFQGAIRDPLQHLLPLIGARPEVARSVLLYSLMEEQPDPASGAGTARDPVLFPDSLIGSGQVRPGTPR
jgi:hypothetical protein